MSSAAVKDTGPPSAGGSRRGLRTAAPAYEMAWWEPHVAFTLAFLLGLWRFAFVQPFIDDTVFNAPAAVFYSRAGLLGPDNWWTQPLKHLLLFPFEMLFGQDPAGWRIRSILLAAGAVTLMMLVGRRAFRNRMAAIAAAVLLALDPLWLVMSRTTTEDIATAFFMLLSMLFFLRLLDEESEGSLAGFALSTGVSFALRWYAAVPSAVMVCALLWAGTGRGWQWRARTLAVIGVTSLSVYLAAYLPWLMRGYTLADWWVMQLDALRVQDASMAFQAEFLRLAGAGRWLFGSVKAAMGDSVGGVGRYTVMMNNFPVWFAFLPAAVLTALKVRRGKSVRLAAVLGSFISLYLFFILSPRRIYLYSAVALIPFGFLLLGYALSRMPKKWALAALSVAILWSAYLLPLTSSIPVPEATYAWILRGGL